MRVSFDFEGTAAELQEFSSLFFSRYSTAPASEGPVEEVVEVRVEPAEVTSHSTPHAPLCGAGGVWGAAPEAEPPPELTARVSPEQRQAAWESWCEMLKTWVEGFEVQDAPQPNRAEMIKDYGTSKHVLPLLVMAYEQRSLQKLMSEALKRFGHPKAIDIDFLERLAGNVLSLSHVGFPDIVGAFDYGTKWKRGIA